MIALIIMDQSTEAIYKLCALIALLGLASPRDNTLSRSQNPMRGLLKASCSTMMTGRKEAFVVIWRRTRGMLDDEYWENRACDD